MNETIEDAARAAIQEEAKANAELACLLHKDVTVLHLAKNKCPICHPAVDPKEVIRALHAIATAPAPFAEVADAIKAMQPFTAQLATKAITVYGQTVSDIRRLGAVQDKLREWLAQADPVLSVREAFARLSDAQRSEVAENFCRWCFTSTVLPDGSFNACHCENDE